MEINGYKLDSEQENIVYDNSNYLLVVAGAGAGKTLTILGKIKYLLSTGIKSDGILCISFTNEACNSLREKLKMNCMDINVLTFHKLSLNILKNKYQVADPNTLDNIIDNFFKIDVLYNEKMLDIVLK